MPLFASIDSGDYEGSEYQPLEPAYLDAEYQPREPAYLDRDYQPREPAFLDRNFAAAPALPVTPFPFQNHHEEEAAADRLPSRLDMRLNKLLTQLPSFGLRRPDIFDLQPQLGFGLADFRMGAEMTLGPAAATAEGQKKETVGMVAGGRGPFPQLTMKQRQFAVSPELPEFFQDQPDFLGERENKELKCILKSLSLRTSSVWQ
jgi:hypothetical protein